MTQPPASHPPNISANAVEFGSGVVRRCVVNIFIFRQGNQRLGSASPSGLSSGRKQTDARADDAPQKSAPGFLFV